MGLPDATEMLADLDRSGANSHDPVGKVMRDTLALLSAKQRAQVAAVKRRPGRTGPYRMRLGKKGVCSRCQCKIPKGQRGHLCKRCATIRQRDYYRRTRAVKV